MLPSTPEGRRNLFLQYGPDYSFGRPNTPSSQHADHSGSSSSMEQYTHERERYPSPDSHPLAQRIHAPSRSQQAPENLSSMTSSNRSTSSHQHSNVHEHDQGMAGQSSTRLAMHQRRQFQNGPGASPRQIRRTKSVENLRVAHTNAQQPLVRATAPLPAATQPSVPAMHKSKSGPLRETMRRVFSRGDHASTSNSPQRYGNVTPSEK